MEAREFLHVFPDVQIHEKIREYFQDVNVTRVLMRNKDMSCLIYIESHHLIPKEFIFSMEEALRMDYFFGNDRVHVTIVERYILSDLYNLETLTEAYISSFLTELSHFNHTLFRMLKRGDYSIEDGILTLSIEDSLLAHDREGELIKYFTTIYSERFGMNVGVAIKYVERKESRKKDFEDELRRKAYSFGDDTVSYDQDDDYSIEEADDTDDSTDIVSKSKLNNEDTKADSSKETDLNKEAGNVTASKQAKSKNAGQDASKNKKFYNPATAGGKGNYKDKKFHRKPTDDPDCFYGSEVEGECVPMNTIEEGMGTICIKGQIISMEEKELRSGKFLYSCNITDFVDSITFKVFAKPDDKKALLEDLYVGGFYKLKGKPEYDEFSKEVNISRINGIKPIPDFTESRKDEYPEKRVELHLHTVFSESDAVTDIAKMIKRAKAWGHKAIAITDHGVAQAFPVANHCVSPDEDFKIIYGLEGYFVDDLKTLVLNPDHQNLDSDYVVFDIETTGIGASRCKIIEIGAVRVNKDGEEIGRFSEFINPGVPIPYKIQQLTSITDEMVKNAPPIEVILPKFLEFCKGAMLVAHNANFDTEFIKENCRKLGYEYPFTALDTMTLAYVILPELGRYNLDRLCKHFGVVNAHHHRACDDADVTAKIFVKLMEMIRKKGIDTVDQLNEFGKDNADAIKKAKTYHGIILVKNETGRVNLYRLISESHITYFNRRPRLPMSLINKYREGLILGSACSSGELYNSILEGAADEEITRIVKYFDYLEVQPLGNDQYLIDDERQDYVNSKEDLIDINKRIIRLGKEFNKPVVATGDVHFLDPEDAIYRTIILEGSRDKGPNKKKVEVEMREDIVDSIKEEMEVQPPLYLRTTEEMLKEFDYLDSDLAKELVITNPNKIADMIEKISPVRPDKCPPVIENSDQILRDICHDKAHEIYGPNLPEIVEKRLEKELNSIISNGYSVMYVIAQKLVWKSVADGYLVGSRGSVGSSFAATMAGITEVNPLSPHYICPECHFTDFDSPEVLKYSGMSGCDMPDRDCPCCGHKLIKEGHDIPFETFLGFKGDKEPDIDLNFSGDYQPRAHAYIEEIFGKGYAFRAGTIATYADKTVYGYVLGYCEKRGIKKRKAEMDRLVKGCLGVKRTTGQHPGGMIVLPNTEEIYSFTPIQKPANDMSAAWTTTHFEYHSIDHNLLKFDILGHDDPTMIRRLEDLTGLDATKIPLDDKKVLSIFHNTDALGIKPEDIDGTRLGTLGIPEFGTDFAMQMVIDANPEWFSDLVRISGLSHGTDVWLGNAQTLIEEGKCKLSSAICCRDDIMVYLIHMGLEPGTAFSIMEKVRKGIVAKGKCDKWPEWKQDMLDHNVPDWYIWSCEKIKYMFPKAHAVAYVMMAWRVAYFKIYYPLAYYAAFFGIRATAFDYGIMCRGRENLDRNIEELKKKDKNDMTAKEAGLMKDMRLVQEMYARGFEFEPIDIYKADDKKFQIINGKIMPALSSIEGMGGTAAQQLKEAAKDGLFMSQEELKNRAKIPQAAIDKMAEYGILGDMPKTSQLTFDFL